MKLTYRVKTGIISVLIIIFFFILNLTLLGKEVKNFFYLISSPIQKKLWEVGDKISNFFETVAEIKNLKKENEELKSKIQELLAENITIIELKKENELLREALKIGLEKEFKLTFTQVRGKDLSQDFILIGKGAKDGILVDSPVITQEKVLIGKVSQVYRNFSKVLLISHPQSSFDGKIISKDKEEVFGVVKGKGNLRVLFDLIPKEKEIEKRDLVVTSALSGIFPENLLIGEISQIRKLDLEPFQTAEIQPLFNLKDLKKLFIITEW